MNDIAQGDVYSNEPPKTHLESPGDIISRLSEVVPTGFLRFSDAFHRLSKGMFATLPRPTPVAALNRQGYKADFGDWRKHAAESLATAAKNGELTIYVFGNPKAHECMEKAEKKRHPDGKPMFYDHTRESEIIPVPTTVLCRLISARGGFPNRPRVSFKAAVMDGALFNALNNGLLVVSQDELMFWYQKERAKGRWPSQSLKEKKVGRRSKQTESLRNAVAAILVASPTISFAKIHRELLASGRDDVPSVDTVADLVRKLHLESGDERFRRRKKIRRKWKPAH